MKKFILLLTAVVAAISLSAAPVDQAAAMKKAQLFLKNQLYAGRLMAPAAVNPVLLKAEMGDVKLNQPVYYIFNTASTFLVVAGDDRAEEILMVGDAPLPDVNKLPPSMQDMLRQYKNEIMFLQEHPGLKVEPIVSPQNAPELKAVTIGPLLTCNWDQTAPYYNQCKFTYNNQTYQCLTGCPATSASMVMYYWSYPKAATPTVPAYNMTFNDNYSLYVEALPSTTFDWDNMKDSYSSGYNSAQANAVATLMRYVGQAEKMDYGTDASGINVTKAQNVVTMYKLFGYDEETCRLVLKNNLYSGSTIYTDAQWAAMIQEEMAAKRPIVFMAVDENGTGGHAFNVDGYRDSDNKYHINFGWSGTGNSWCALNAFGYSSSWSGTYKYTQYQQMIIGIQPPTSTDPVLKVDTDSLSFTGFTGDTYTKTFTVRGRFLQGDVNLSVSGSEYTLSRTTIPANEALQTVTVTVTYHPSTAGTHTGTVTISTPGGESKTVELTGTATDRPVVTATPSALNFNTSVGKSVIKTFSVKGVNLAAAVSLSVSGEGFSIDKKTISKTAASATNGATVTVTYKPTEAGTHTGTITITSANALAQTVTLNGVADDDNPIIRVNPAALSFNAYTGESATQTFTVTGANLTGNLSVALNDANGVYSINKTSITTSQATSGAVVTVTYAPTTMGNHQATVTVSGGDAAAVTVNLNGQASLSKFTPVMLPVNNELVDLTSFRADWTDQTPAANVASYTLEVNARVVDPVLLSSINGANYTSTSYNDITLPAPWGGTYVRGGRNVIYFRNNYSSSNTPGNITYTIPEGYNNATFTMKITSGSSSNGVGNFTVATLQTAAVGHQFAAGETFYWLVTGSTGDKITITTTDNQYSPDISVAEVYAGDATPKVLMATETGGADSRLIEGITPDNKYYMVKNLAEGGTFLYRVKALYIDGSESDWSNIEEVTLFANEHPYASGDVNHDNAIDIDDVTALINAVLGNDSEACPVCANTNGDGAIDIDDVTALINKVLGNIAASLNAACPAK